ncbi:hypothetical protein N2152v2_008327 [Parachlorella kessleri]
MRLLGARTASVLARLAAPSAECSLASRRFAVVGSLPATEVALALELWGPCSQPCSSSSSSTLSSNWSWGGQARGFASAAAEPAQATASAAAENSGLIVSDAAVERLKELGPGSVLRIMVEGGGCSGFQYEFSLDEVPKEDDRVFERDGIRVVCDNLSLEFLRGATIDYESDLMRSAFVVSGRKTGGAF